MQCGMTPPRRDRNRKRPEPSSERILLITVSNDDRYVPPRSTTSKARSGIGGASAQATGLTEVFDAWEGLALQPVKADEDGVPVVWFAAEPLADGDTGDLDDPALWETLEEREARIVVLPRRPRYHRPLRRVLRPRHHHPAATAPGQDRDQEARPRRPHLLRRWTHHLGDGAPLRRLPRERLPVHGDARDPASPVRPTRSEHRSAALPTCAPPPRHLLLRREARWDPALTPVWRV